MPMELLSKKLLKTHHDPAHVYGGHLAHWCPACKTLHEFAVHSAFRNGARWTHTGGYDAPTFSPSMNIRTCQFPAASKRAGQTLVCHYFVKAGRIEYLSDCTHELAGQTVDLPDLPPSVLEQIEVSQRYAAASS